MIQTTLRRLFRFREGEGRLVLLLGALLLINSIAMQVSYVASVSGFLSEGSVGGIVVVWLASYLLTLGISAAQFVIVDRFNKRSLLIGVAVVFALLLYVVWWMGKLGAPGYLTYGLLYVIAEQQWLFFPLAFWALANDTFTMAQAKRLFPVIASIGFAGKLIGLGLSALAPTLAGRFSVALPELLLLGFVLYLLAAVVTTRLPVPRGSSRVPEKAQPLRETLAVGFDFVRDVPVFKYLAIAVCVLAGAETILEFQFLVQTERAFARPEQYQTFYGAYRLFTTVTAFALQATVTSRLIERLTLRNASLVTPVTLFAASGLMLAFPTFLASALGITATRVVRDTIDESSQKALQAVVPSEKRGRVSVFIDSYVLALGTVAACLLLLAILGLERVWGPTVARTLYLTLAFTATAVGVWASVRLRNVYENSMLNWRLRRRQRGGGVIDRLDF